MSEARRGAALVAALALLALSAALVSGTFAVARAVHFRTRAESARLTAEAAAMRALVLLTAGWGSAEDTLAPGASLERDLAETLTAPPDAGPAVRGRTRISRLTDRGYLVAVDVRIGDAPVLARRRLSLLLVRPPLDSASVARGDPLPAPRPVTSWTLADLY